MQKNIFLAWLLGLKAGFKEKNACSACRCQFHAINTIIGDLALTDEVDKVDIKFRTSKGRSDKKIISTIFF